MEEIKLIDSGPKSSMSLKEIGESVRNAREQKGLTQEELAKELGINITSLRLVENGSQRSGKKLLNNIALRLGITFELSFPYNPETKDQQ